MRFGSSAPTVPARLRRRRELLFLLAVFAAVASAVVVSYAVYLAQSPRPPPTTNVVFDRPVVERGNATFSVASVAGGPYAASEFAVNLVVNGFRGTSIALAPSGEAAIIVIGPNAFEIVWTDADADGTVSAGDRFLAAGHGVPLPALSLFEFNLEWRGEWTAKAFWTTR